MEYSTVNICGHRKEVSKICYGCAAAWARPLISDDFAESLFLKALEGGITYFDTGHSYGIAEYRIGKILAKNCINRDKVVISTKFGTRIQNGRYTHDVSREWILKSVETSLKRMGLSFIDVLYVHGPKLADFTDEFFSVLEDLKRQGIVGLIGANSFDVSVIDYIEKNRCVDVVMLDYNIVKRDREPLINRLYESGIQVVAGQAMAEGLFSNDLFKLRNAKDLWYVARTIGRKSSRELFCQAWKYRFLNQYGAVKASQIALKYVIDNPKVLSASVGTCSLSHLESNLNAVDVNISESLLQQIRNIR